MTTSPQAPHGPAVCPVVGHAVLVYEDGKAFSIGAYKMDGFHELDT